MDAGKRTISDLFNGVPFPVSVSFPVKHTKLKFSINAIYWNKNR